MMKNLKLTLLALFSLALLRANAQETSESQRLTKFADVSVSLADGFLGSLAYQHSWGIGSKQKLQLSYGLRVSGFSGNEMEFYSAPIDYYLIESETDTLSVSNPGQNNIAIYLGATYKLGSKVELGFNIDAIGYTFGSEKDVVFNGNNGEVINTTASPNQVTALLVGANDIGFIKVEFFASYKVSDKLAIRLGLNKNYIEYKTATELQAGNTRYRGAPSGIMFGVRYQL